MADAELLSAFISVTGQETVACTHCHKTNMPLEKFLVAIRRRCEKKGIFAEMKLPKTCDNQLLRNDKRNKIANQYYYKIKRAETEDDKAQLKAALKEAVMAAQ